ncbi:hypothetical protein QTI66_38375 [Variovorax sp. J22R133]|uniref:hypothetical protein n=1 Tax=Variovorax brevis TaxID=3053503 RepID=UPI002578FEDE|nr:hypothetical protein [Variovorax sp. J22R133]MDM0117957.1 hypothetical protein [Variovorax sp. J22R133]
MATFHDARTDTCFEVHMLGDRVSDGMVMTEGRREIDQAQALQGADAYADLAADATACAEFKAAGLRAKLRNAQRERDKS